MKISIFVIYYIFVYGSLQSVKKWFSRKNKKTILNTTFNTDSLTNEKTNIDQNILQKDQKISEIYDEKQYKMVFKIFNSQTKNFSDYISTYKVESYEDCKIMQSTIFLFCINLRLFILTYFKVKTDIIYEKWINNEANDFKTMYKFCNINKSRLSNLKNNMNSIFIEVEKLKMLCIKYKASDQNSTIKSLLSETLQKDYTEIISSFKNCLNFANDISAYKNNEISIEDFDKEDLTKLENKLKENVPTYF